MGQLTRPKIKKKLENLKNQARTWSLVVIWYTKKENALKKIVFIAQRPLPALLITIGITIRKRAKKVN